MQFNDECKVIIQTMNGDEAKTFVKFLYSEILRHKMDIEEAEKLILYVKDEFALLDDALDLNETWHGGKNEIS